MHTFHLPVGISDFAEIRENHFYYVDKSLLVERLLKTTGTKVTLITRPRRFGKTIGMSMLANFFDIRKESSKLFEGLNITQNHYKEDFYHAFLAGIFTGAGYMVESNREHGEGRSDVVVYDSLNGKVEIFEAKYSEKLKDIENDCNRALRQINTRMYAEEYEDDYDQILCYGISFFKKRCLVKIQ